MKPGHVNRAASVFLPLKVSFVPRHGMRRSCTHTIIVNVNRSNAPGQIGLVNAGPALARRAVYEARVAGGQALPGIWRLVCWPDRVPGAANACSDGTTSARLPL